MDIQQPNLLQSLAEMMPKATIYTDRGFQGGQRQLQEGRYDLRGEWAYRDTLSDTLRYEANDAVSSVKVVSGYKVTLYDNADCTGASKTFTADTEYVGDDFDDKASSVVVAKV
jgi:hypothetical protein